MATKHPKNIVSFWICLLVATVNIVSHGCVQGLMNRNKYQPEPRGTVKTIEVPENGDLVDCVDIYKQPAFKNSLKKDIQMEPSAETLHAFNQSNGPQQEVIQSWHKYGECPAGTIPIRRTWSKNDPFSRKYPDNQLAPREYATAVVARGRYNGVSAYFNVWKPHIQEGVDEFSLSQMWLISDRGLPGANTIELGWIVYPEGFPDSNTRLFTFWTRDLYQTTGCYNLDCDGFMQTNTRISLGMGIVLTPSVYEGAQYDVFIKVVRESSTGRWYVQIGNEILGFFPPEIFTSLNNGAEEVDFGGEIVNLNTENQHTNTHMGSGHFAEEGFGRASFVRNVMVGDLVLEDAELLLSVTAPECYDLLLGPPFTTYGSHFYFGGPGRSQYCP